MTFDGKLFPFKVIYDSSDKNIISESTESFQHIKKGRST